MFDFKLNSHMVSYDAFCPLDWFKKSKYTNKTKNVNPNSLCLLLCAFFLIWFITTGLYLLHNQHSPTLISVLSYDAIYETVNIKMWLQLYDHSILASISQSYDYTCLHFTGCNTLISNIYYLFITLFQY